MTQIVTEAFEVEVEEDIANPAPVTVTIGSSMNAQPRWLCPAGQRTWSWMLLLSLLLLEDKRKEDNMAADAATE